MSDVVTSEYMAWLYIDIPLTLAIIYNLFNVFKNHGGSFEGKYNGPFTIFIIIVLISCIIISGIVIALPDIDDDEITPFSIMGVLIPGVYLLIYMFIYIKNMLAHPTPTAGVIKVVTPITTVKKGGGKKHSRGGRGK